MKKLLFIALLFGGVVHPAVGKTLDVTDEQITCLAKNIYMEARGESLAGQIAVGLVTINRVYDKRFPNTICDVVFQSKKDKKGNPLRNKCQFSWYCDGKSDKITNWKTYGRIKELSYRIIAGMYSGMVEGATFYHATSVNPNWSLSFREVTQIDDHIFYYRD
jgi:spore germination cell wall hydrolase CwlJ-like protein